MSKLFIHAGWNKCGSTSMQINYFRKLFNPDVCDGRRVYLHSLGLEDYSNNQGKLLISDEAILSIQIGQVGPRKCRTQKRINFLRNWYKIAPHTKFIIGIRDPQSMLESLYKQYLQKGGTLLPNKFLSHDSSDGYISLKEMLYCPVLNELYNLFKEKHFIYKFDNFCRNQESFWFDLDKFMNMNGEMFALYNPCYSRINQGITYQSGLILRNVNKWASSSLNPNGLISLPIFKMLSGGRSPRQIFQGKLASKLFKQTKQSFTYDLYLRFKEELDLDYSIACNKYVNLSA